MLSNREVLLCRYHYDPLDRLVDCTPSAQANTRRFYLKDRLATEIQGAVQRSVMQHEDQLLAQQQRQSGTLKTTLVATDQQRSVLSALDAAPPRHLAYTPYGHRSPEDGLLSLLGFNGERPDPVTGCYLLGNGYRAFNPVLMRFNSPDSWSPFGEGGLNAYAYCVGDPVNHNDRSGHAGVFGMLKFIGRKLGFRQSSRAARADQAYELTVQSPVSIPTSRANGTPAGPPPLYTAEPSAQFSRGTSSQPLDAPPPYSQSQTHLMTPPPYSTGNGVTSLGARSISTPNLEPPPSYFPEQRTRVLSARQARIQPEIDRLRAHRQRVQQAFTGRPLSESAQATIDSLTTEITNLRRR